jgi:ferredoxin-nitrate reductase
MHWGALWADQAEANAMTHPIACPDSKQPELKACAVQLVPIPAEPTLLAIQNGGLLKRFLTLTGR